MSAAVCVLPAPRLRIVRRLPADAQGFGLVELLIALMVLNVGIFATVAAFNSGALALRRANRTATVSVIADKQMELYRGLFYDDIGVLAPASPCDPPSGKYCSDAAYAGSATVATCTANPATACQPMRAVTGPDGRQYRIDTYVHTRVETPATATTPYAGRTLKVVAVVVRDAATLASLLRTESTFDKAATS